MGHVGEVGRAVGVRVGHLGDFDFVGRLGSGVAFRDAGDAEEVQLALHDGGAGVAGGDEFAEAEEVEVEGEVLEEVAFVGVVAVAEDGLALELVAVVAHLRLDVGQLRVELVCLVLFGLCQRGCSHFTSILPVWCPCPCVSFPWIRIFFIVAHYFSPGQEASVRRAVETAGNGLMALGSCSLRASLSAS